tara:strand:- start:2703 stop:2951 length:249 start_codon:yes stop_codon:yes gene_type:complete
MSNFTPSDFAVSNEDEDYLTRVVIDTNSRKIYLYSSDGDSKTVECETVDQFMSVLELVRLVIDEDLIVYCEPVTATPAKFTF